MITSKNLVWSIASAALFVAMSASASAQSIVVDEFTGPLEQQVIELTGETMGSDSRVDPDVLGGARDVQFAQSAANGILPASAVVNPGGSYTVYEMSFPKDAMGNSVLQYDGPDGSMDLDYTGLGGINFTQNGQSRLTIDVPFSDHATELSVMVYTDENSASEYTVPVEIVQLGDPVLTKKLPYNQFTQKSGFDNPADFANVGAIEVYLDGQIPGGALDVQIASIGTTSIPEPGAVVTFLTGVFGLLGFGWHGMRRRRRARISA